MRKTIRVLKIIDVVVIVVVVVVVVVVAIVVVVVDDICSSSKLVRSRSSTRRQSQTDVLYNCDTTMITHPKPHQSSSLKLLVYF